MTDLAGLLKTAKAADPGERIQFRDPIAAHGARAIPAMRDSLEDARLGAFAVRVLGRIAEVEAYRAAVLHALSATDSRRQSERVNQDLAVDQTGRAMARSSGGITD